MAAPRIEVTAFDELPAEAASEALHHACASEVWQRVLVAGRPFGTATQLVATSDGVIAALAWDDVADALPAHALAVDVPDGVPPAELAAYEQRFGFPFVQETTGRTAEQITDQLRRRLDRDTADEQQAARHELAAIVRRCLLTRFG